MFCFNRKAALKQIWFDPNSDFPLQRFPSTSHFLKKASWLVLSSVPRPLWSTSWSRRWDTALPLVGSGAGRTGARFSTKCQSGVVTRTDAKLLPSPSPQRSLPSTTSQTWRAMCRQMWRWRPAPSRRGTAGRTRWRRETGSWVWGWSWWLPWKKAARSASACRVRALARSRSTLEARVFLKTVSMVTPDALIALSVILFSPQSQRYQERLDLGSRLPLLQRL